MKATYQSLFVRVLAATAPILLLVNSAEACSVCFGDVDSPMAKGAAAGVWTLAAITGFVLFGGAFVGMTWIQRGRRLAMDEERMGKRDHHA